MNWGEYGENAAKPLSITYLAAKKRALLVQRHGLGYSRTPSP